MACFEQFGSTYSIFFKECESKKLRILITLWVDFQLKKGILTIFWMQTMTQCPVCFWRETVWQIPYHQVFNLGKITLLYIWHALGVLSHVWHVSFEFAACLSLLFMHCFAFVHLIGLKNNDKQVALPFGYLMMLPNLILTGIHRRLHIVPMCLICSKFQRIF